MYKNCKIRNRFSSILQYTGTIKHGLVFLLYYKHYKTKIGLLNSVHGLYINIFTHGIFLLNFFSLQMQLMKLKKLALFHVHLHGEAGPVPLND